MPKSCAGSVHELDRAIVAHLQWRIRLNEAFGTGSSPVSVEHASDETLCDLGKWLTGPTIPDQVKSTDLYQSICRIHCDFHKSAAVVLDQALKKVDADTIVLNASLREYDRSSNELLETLLKWRERVL